MQFRHIFIFSVFVYFWPIIFLAITRGGWSYDGIKRYEVAQKKHIPTLVLDWIGRAFDQKFDSDIRLFVYLNTKEVWDATKKPNKTITKEVLNKFFAGPDLKIATPYNNFFLRFSDYSPFLPMRQLETGDAFEIYCGVCLRWL